MNKAISALNTGNDVSLKKTARFAGFLYIIMTVQAPIALLYVPSHIMVDGDPLATTANILAHEFLFRLSIVSQLASVIIFFLLALVLYRLFKKVNQAQASLLVAFVLVQVPITFLLETVNFASLRMAKGEIVNAALEQKADWVMLLLHVHRYGLLISEIFWGLWLLPFGQLVYKSGFIPKIFAYCLFFGCLCWISDSITYLLFPAYHPFVSQIVLKTGWLGEIPIMLWLLVKGIRNNITIQPPPTS